MSKRYIILLVAWIAFAIWIMIATLLSSQNGSSTSETSLRLIRFFANYVPVVRQHESLCNDILRKTAHVIIFMLLCGLLFFALFSTLSNTKQAYIGTVSFSLFFALFDEVKKLFIPGRHLHWLDVGMNVIGVLGGIAIVYVLSCCFGHYIKE